jgi:hypothetical protein
MLNLMMKSPNWQQKQRRSLDKLAINLASVLQLAKKKHSCRKKKGILETFDDVEELESDIDEEDESNSDASRDSDSEGVEENEEADFLAWSQETPPYQPEAAFTGSTGPKHGLSAENVLPIDYFNLFEK